MQAYEIRIAGGEDALKEPVARMLCPDEDHPPPCPVPWSFGYGDGTLVLAIYADRETAEDVARRVRALTPHPSRSLTVTPPTTTNSSSSTELSVVDRLPTVT